MNDLGNVETQYFATEPQEQKKERNEEKAKVQGGRALLLELIERWEERVKFYSSIDSIPEDVRTNPEEFMVAVNANSLTKQNIKAELEYLDSLKRQYL